MAKFQFPKDPNPESMINGVQIVTYKANNTQRDMYQLFMPAQVTQSTNVIYNKDEGKIKRLFTGEGPFGLFGEKTAEGYFGELLGQSGGVFGGKTGNPQLTYTFKTVDQRQHNFSFNMIAKSQSESDEITKMCDSLRNSSLPEKSDDASAFVLTYPDTAQVSFIQDKHLFKISSRCVINSINITYSSASGEKYMEFEGGAPLGVQLDITFEEIQLAVSDRKSGG
jgi:hypothetical protein